MMGKPMVALKEMRRVIWYDLYFKKLTQPNVWKLCCKE